MSDEITENYHYIQSEHLELKDQYDKLKASRDKLMEVLNEWFLWLQSNDYEETSIAKRTKQALKEAGEIT